MYIFFHILPLIYSVATPLLYIWYSQKQSVNVLREKLRSIYWGNTREHRAVTILQYTNTNIFMALIENKYSYFSSPTITHYISILRERRSYLIYLFCLAILDYYVFFLCVFFYQNIQSCSKGFLQVWLEKKVLGICGWAFFFTLEMSWLEVGEKSCYFLT